MPVATASAREHASVILNGRTEDRVQKAIAAIKSRVGDAAVEGFAGDLSKASAADTLAVRYPELDILVNNLGIYEAKQFQDITDDWRRFFEVMCSAAPGFPDFI